MEVRWREAPFWQLEYRRVDGGILRLSMWWHALLGALAAVLLGLFGLAFKHGFASIYLSLAALIVAHLIARAHQDRQLPNPSFLRDLQTGHLEQFRMLDLAPHALLFQRGLPALFYRLQSHILWLPLYAAWGAWVGMPLVESGLLWLLFAFADPLVLILLGFYLTVSLIDFAEGVMLALLVFGYGSLRDADRARLGALSGWVFALMIGLAIVMRLLMPMGWMYPLPDLGRFTLVWLAVEGLRWERRARWLNMPSGLWRYGWLLPATALLLMAFPLSREWMLAWNPVQQVQGYAVLVYWLSGWMSLLLLTLVRGRDPVQQRWSVHLGEVALLRGLSVAVVWGVAHWQGVGFSWGAFWALWLLLTLADVPLGSFARVLLQRGACMRVPLGWLMALGLLPLLWFLLAPDRYASLGVLNPLVALVALTPLWRQFVALPPPPLWILMLLPLLWRGLILTVAWLMVMRPAFLTTRRAAPQFFSWLLAPLLLYPLYDRMQQRVTTNPVTRFFLSERRWDAALPMAVLGWLLGLSLSSWTVGGLAFLHVPVVLMALWWSGYQLASQRLQRLVETGELRQWFLTGLAPNTLYWGLVQSVWSWQIRLIIALYGCGMLGVWVRELFKTVIGTPSPVVSPLLIVLMGSFFSTLMVGVWLLLLGSMLFLAAPVAIQDTLTALSRRERPSLARPAVLSLLYSGCTVMGCFFAPLLLVSLPLYSSRSERILRQLNRAPDEYLQRLPALIR
jgi:hypothetical protein